MKNKMHLGGLLLLAGAVCFLLGPANPRTTVLATSQFIESAARKKLPVVAREPDRTAVIRDVLFDKFLKYKTYDVEAVMYGQPTTLSGGFVHGPGHHSAALAALLIDSKDKPHFVLKTGDTRLSRSDRGEPYVLDGFVAGRLDKEGAGSAAIALAELTEEAGGTVVGETFRPLSGEFSPTMPLDSTECDSYFLACVKIAGKPTGDGGKMEVPELIGAKIVTPERGFRLMDSGEVSDGGRARTMYGRALDAIGYLPSLGVYAQDHPALLSRYDSLGLGEVQDIRGSAVRNEIPEAEKRKSEINDVILIERTEVDLPGDSVMVDAVTKHAVKKGAVLKHVGEAFANQYLKLDYDRAKVAAYFIHPELGPMVLMTKKARPALNFAPGEPRAMRFDVADAQVPRTGEPLEPLEGARQIGKPCGASSGQSDLYYQFWIKEMPVPEKPKGEGYVTLSEAIRLCRSGHGDAQTEALLQRLADELQWIPSLNMSVEEAGNLLTSTS